LADSSAEEGLSETIPILQQIKKSAAAIAVNFKKLKKKGEMRRD